MIKTKKMLNSSDTNEQALIRKDQRAIIEIVNVVFLMTFLCLFGFVSNIINIIVFCKQGFENTMNISFLGLAISDLCSLIHLQLIVILVNPWFADLNIPVIGSEIQYLISSVPHICFVRVTGWITVYVTAERCLCITFPLKIKQLVTRTRTTVTIVAIYVIIMVSFFLEYATCYFDWKLDERSNKTLLGLAFRSNRKEMEGVMYVLYSLSGFTSFIAVIVFTIILVVQLQSKLKWRMKANLNASTAESVTLRDRKTMKMVAVIATVLIACYFPGVAGSILTVVQPEFSIVGKYTNTFIVMWSYGFLFEAVNSSMNIFIYYHMGSKYRNTFIRLFSSEKRHSAFTSTQFSRTG